VFSVSSVAIGGTQDTEHGALFRGLADVTLFRGRTP